MTNLLLTINGGSSSIKFALFEPSDPPGNLLTGEIERVGKPGTVLSAKGLGPDVKDQPIQADDHTHAAEHLTRFIRQRIGNRTISAIGHRVVHGGFFLVDHCVIDAQVMSKLRDAIVLDSAHLPREISLIESFASQFPDIPQVACFDTAFHQSLPIVSKMLPIPGKYFDHGIRRFGFHGLSYAYLMQQLKNIAGQTAHDGRVILAHLGSGASMTAVKNGKPIDTSMSFTPIAGLMMGTRPGDLDPGVLIYLLRTEKLSADQLDDLLNKSSGLLGVSGTSADMRDLTEKQSSDPRAAIAVQLFCQTAKKQIGSYAAALNGLDTLVFAGGIGEHSPEARRQICEGLDFLGIQIDSALNNSSAVKISTGPVSVYVMPTDEQIMIASITRQFTIAP